MTRQNVAQLDEFKAIADRYGAQLRLTRLRPSGRGADVWDELHPTAAQQRELYDWLLAHGDEVLTGDSFFHLAGYGEALPGLNLCGAGRVVCLIDPVGDVYACPFAIHDAFLAGNVRDDGRLHHGLARVRAVPAPRRPQSGGACASCSAYDACRGGCMAAKFFTGLPLDGPDPECVQGHGEPLLSPLPERGSAAAVGRPLAPAAPGVRRVSRLRRPSRRRPARGQALMAAPGSRPVAEAQRRAKKRLPTSVYGRCGRLRERR